PLEQQLITEGLDSLEYNYFMLCINDEFKLYEKLQRVYDEKSLINQKLKQTYDEKSLINKKLKITYKEKHERGVKIKELKAENIKLQDEIEDMKNSMVWKIGSILTKPFKKG
ncbi:MAG: hypothetical protein LUH02_06865, partial [Erysipelotrichaceae bacterium]|nr:hypothetical protein [Erysipelotrichaceae bacterium]